MTKKVPHAAHNIRADELEKAAAEIEIFDCLGSDNYAFAEGYQQGYRTAVQRIAAMLRMRATAWRALGES